MPGMQDVIPSASQMSELMVFTVVVDVVAKSTLATYKWLFVANIHYMSQSTP